MADTADTQVTDTQVTDTQSADAQRADAQRADARSARERSWPRLRLGGVAFDAISEAEVVAHVAACLRAGTGGRIVTPNVDILRQVSADPKLGLLVAGSDLVVADGMPLVWAARLSGRPLPGRVPGSDLIWSLSASAAAHGHAVYLLGGAAGVPERAATVLTGRFRGMRVAGTDSPALGFDRDPQAVRAVLDRVLAARPDLVFVGLGFPKQELLIDQLAARLPAAWFLGCGASISFVAGTLRRAPAWMQRTGLEWAYRLGSEPTRLVRRYLVHDAPYAARLLTLAVGQRHWRRGTPPLSGGQPSAAGELGTAPPIQRSGSGDMTERSSAGTG